MTDKKKLENVFKTVGLPPYTYVKPAHYGEVRADISQPGKHLLIEGPSGVGKTCVAFKAFEELNWMQGTDYSYVSCRDPDAEDAIDKFFGTCQSGGTPSPAVIVIDDLHLLTVKRRAEIGAILKRMSDRAFERQFPPKAVLVGIPTTGVSLLSDAYDLGPRLGSYLLERASDGEIEKLMGAGEVALNILFEDPEVLLAESAGNFWLAQYICNKVCATKEIYETTDNTEILTFDLLAIRQRLMTELAQRYMPAAKTFAKGKKWRPGGNKPYLEIFLAICKIPDSAFTFDRILNVVAERRRPGIKAVRQRISQMIFDLSKNIDLRKQVAFDPDSGFSIEDPLFRYFLTNLDTDRLLSELGIESGILETGRLYSFDVGFSFAGEVRQLVEVVNEEMKNEDVVTFYDFDLQAFLLALDLEETLGRIYSGSCRYYLVFMDENYRQKVWTKYERDVMTKQGRKNHIVPVILDEGGTYGTVGISSTIGRIDLRDVWAEVLKTRQISADAVNIIRNRCVLPMLEKLNEN